VDSHAGIELCFGAIVQEWIGDAGVVLAKVERRDDANASGFQNTTDFPDKAGIGVALEMFKGAMHGKDIGEVVGDINRGGVSSDSAAIDAGRKRQVLLPDFHAMEPFEDIGNDIRLARDIDDDLARLQFAQVGSGEVFKALLVEIIGIISRIKPLVIGALPPRPKGIKVDPVIDNRNLGSAELSVDGILVQHEWFPCTRIGRQARKIPAGWIAKAREEWQGHGLAEGSLG